MPIITGKRLGPYEILSAIGAGGMGEVYRAHDSKLGRDVAIKVLPDAFAHDPERLSRFQREAKMLAALNHPNIATIYGLEQSNGTSYLVMELVSGETLQERIRRDGPVPIDEALSIAKQIAEALEAAHEKGIIHRDLKPANVKVTPEGKVKVLDFGLAKAFAEDTETSDPINSPTLSMAATMYGVILGTAAYMSPEQARGKAVDRRTDIWAFGCVLHELLTAKQAFRGETTQDTIAAVLGREPDWQALPPATPRRIRDLLRRCLQKDAQRRLRDFGDVRIEIEEASTTATLQPWRFRRAVVGIAAVVLIISLAAAGWFYRFAERGETIDSVAVLPFVNTSGNPDTEYLSDGLADSLINSLSQVPKLRVTPRSTVFRYKGQVVDPQKIGRDLNVGAVLTGRVVQRGDVLIIGTELLDVAHESQLWGEQYNRKLTDVLVVQEDIANAISEKLRLKLSGKEQQQLNKSYTVNPEAYQGYLKGRYWWNKRTEEGFRKGIEYFQQAIAKDPTYALAYSGLADCYSLLAVYDIVSPREAYPEAKEAALKALEIDDTLAEAHTSLGFVKTNYDWDWSGGEREYQRAIELNPSYATAHQWRGEALAGC